ncbi:Uncharacterized protein Fot_20194 [Forsythia ovata]|uniref:Uncharacterized protein n=1 Tax=Forsythia ovata TaxID=205694 RepID=A0ABD1VQ95_9LAMI
MSIRRASHGKKARKRALATSHDSSKPMKMPKLGIHEAYNFSMLKRMTCINFEGDTEVIGQSFESDFAKNKDEHTVLTGKDSFSGTGTARSGPVKLTARSKAHTQGLVLFVLVVVERERGEEMEGNEHGLMLACVISGTLFLGYGFCFFRYTVAGELEAMTDL